MLIGNKPGKSCVLTGLGVLVLLPVFGESLSYFLHLAITIFIFAIISSGWNILGGYCGFASFGHAVFYGLGSYTSALFLTHYGLPLYVTLPLAGFAAAVFSIIWGYPCIRLRGPFFSIATLGVSEATRIVMANWESLTGGASGITLPIEGSKVMFYYLALAVSVFTIFLSYCILHSRYGVALLSIKQDIEAAESLGINSTRYSLGCLILSAFIVGLGGSLYTHYMYYIEPQSAFSFQLSITMILITIVGGLGTVWGPVLGTLVFVVLQNFVLVSFPQLHLLVYGILLIVIILFEPRGFLGLLSRSRVPSGKG